MRPKRRTRRARATRFIPLALLAVIVGSTIAWAVGALHIPGLPPPTAFARAGDEPPDRSGQVGIVIAARDLPAYTQLAEDDLAVRWMDGKGVKEPLVDRRDWGKVIGRVLRRPLRGGHAVTLDGLFPEGTRGGIVAGIPPGKRALKIEADRIQGIYGLRIGDRFDLVATLPLDERDLGDLRVAGLWSERIALEAGVRNWKKQATVRVVARDGVVVSPVETRLETKAVHSLVSGQGITQVPVEEITIAVAPDEVASLTEAIAVGAAITCVPRSGQPGDEPSETVPNEPRTPLGGGNAGTMVLLESIHGEQRRLIAVPTGERK